MWYNEGMIASFIKALKWAVLVAFAIGGVYGLSEAGRLEDARYIMMTVVCFGVVYMMFRIWSDLSSKVMGFSAALVAALALAAHDPYAPFWLYVFADIDLSATMGYFRIWASLVGTIGVLIMTVVFYKYDKDTY